ncbi:MAG: hypothetical protein PHU85_05130 [Phycisphaerae bacterium]|nr:hypothetical protein [Phycisphaerae bacterium]
MSSTAKRFRGTLLLAVAALLSLAPLAALAEPTTQPVRKTGGPAKLEEVHIYLVLKGGEKLIGDLDGFDGTSVRVRDSHNKVLSAKWDQLMPTGCYHLQKRLTNPNSAEVNFRLGVYCVTNGLRDEAEQHFAKTRRLDPSYADKIKRAYTGKLITKPDLAVALADQKEVEELEKTGIAGTESQRNERPKDLVKYQAFSPKVQAQAVEKIRTFGDQVNEKMGTKLRSVETNHFIIFTEWPEAEDRAVSEMFESIYARLCGQFDIPTSENIYLGKLPVFAWNTRDSFVRFAKEAHRLEVRSAVMAYVSNAFNGFQMMNCYAYSNKLLLELILTHECVHTFVNRYRSNMPLEGWLNEGLAEVMSGTMVPRAGSLERGRKMVAAALKGIDIKALLTAGFAPPTPPQYPQATTLVDYLLRKDPSKFLTMVDKIKSGTATEASLKDAYGLDYDALETAWRRWVSGGYPKIQ